LVSAAARRGAVLRALADEIVAAFHRMRAVSEALHDDGEASAGRRGVLRELARLGPRTVPDMARARPVSRQYIQVLVDGLLADGLVDLEDNPAHARSRLVRITPGGRRVLAASEAREAEVYEALAARFDAREIERATALLRDLREALADHMGARGAVTE
jgi:DNA-binding MarR family transcriptional regulator